MRTLRVMKAMIYGTVMTATAVGSAAAQHEGHQMPGMSGPAGPETVAACGQNAQAVTEALDAVYARIEDARQTNNAATMRAAIGDLQVEIAQLKTQLADCASLRTATPATNQSSMAMAGMDHSKMAMPAGPAVPQPGAPIEGSQTDEPKMPGMAMPTSEQRTKQNGAVAIRFRSEPTPLRVGDNRLEVTLEDRDGHPIADAEVSLAFDMPAMPSMNMPEMRSMVKLSSTGNGIYRGSGAIGMGGEWTLTIAATRGGKALGVKQVKLTAR